MGQQYNREEMYQKVWEKPMLRVAEEYGVSSVALEIELPCEDTKFHFRHTPPK
jgi:hypothetical protein